MSAISSSSKARVWTVERSDPRASTGTWNQGSGRSGRRAGAMLVLPELEAPFRRRTRPPSSVVTAAP
jgi:hypothetical protein